jgi:hypothetical protein
MIVVRAWPDAPPPGRPYAVDDWPRVPVDSYDYRGLAATDDGTSPGVISMDWDTAAGIDDLRRFAAHAAETPDEPLTAPVRLYCDGPYDMPEPKWNAKLYNRGFVTLRYVTEADPACHLFGFGLVYLPYSLIGGFMVANPGKAMDDTSFSGWYSGGAGSPRETRIDWSVRPVHLHYNVPAGGRVL